MIYFCIIAGVIAADQATKFWILNTFRLYDAQEVIPGFFNLVHVQNTGAAFSMLADVDSPWRHHFFLGIGAIALVGLTVAHYKLKQNHRLYSVALPLIAGGAAGNLVDRVRLGAVVDFLDFYIGRYHWPAFNVADSAICIGAGLFLIVNVLETRNKEAREQV